MESTERAGKPQTLPKKFYGWLRPAWASSEEEVIRTAGYDAAMYVKILSFGERFLSRLVAQNFDQTFP